MSTVKSTAYVVSACGVFLWETSDSSDFKTGSLLVLIGVGCSKRGLSFSADFPGLPSFPFSRPVVQKFCEVNYSTESWAGCIDPWILCTDVLSQGL